MRGHRWKSMDFPAIVGLIKHPAKGYILFDTGYAKRFLKETEKFPERFYRMLTPMHLCDKEQLIKQLNERNIAADDINSIFISHFHADHIAGLLDFPKAEYICSYEGYSAFEQRSRISGLIKGYLKKLLPQDFLSRVTFIEDKVSIKLDKSYRPFDMAYDVLGDGALLAIDMPGHAHGHFGLLYHQGESVNFLVGDACWTQEAYTQGLRPNLMAHIIMSNATDYYATLDNLSRLYGANKELLIIPSHCQKTYEKWCHGS